MPGHVKSVRMDLWNGGFTETLAFQPGLNILSGENGAGKTMVLKAIRQGSGVARDGLPEGQALRIHSMSPKRNSERRAAAEALRQVRQNDQLLTQSQTQRLNNTINDYAVETYLGLADLFFSTYEARCKEAGGDQTQIMHSVIAEYNSTLKQVFPNYELRAKWVPKIGPDLSLFKDGQNEVPLQALSCGEQEALSLIFNLTASSDLTDVFLVDEPEVHLNWHLEERLFTFFAHFCEAQGKQMIVATHSRTIFTSRFLPKVQFLAWQDGKVRCSADISPETRRRLAGEAIEIVRLGEFSRLTFFVEDDAHETVVDALATEYGALANVVRCGDKSQVRAMFRLAEKEGGWKHAHFVEDGDGEGPSKEFVHARFVHLERYCMENYLLDYETLGKLTNKTTSELQQLVYGALKERSGDLFRKVKSLSFVLNQLQPSDMTTANLKDVDASLLLGPVLKKLGLQFDAFVREYVRVTIADGRASAVLPHDLVKAMQHASPKLVQVATTNP